MPECTDNTRWPEKRLATAGNATQRQSICSSTRGKQCSPSPRMPDSTCVYLLSPFLMKAEIVKSNIGARDYIECSALTGEGVQKVFDIATRAGLVRFHHVRLPDSTGIR
jgi:hypothetical protein